MLIRIIESVSAVTAKVAAWSAVAMMVLVFSSVFARYVLVRPILFADEVASYLLVFFALIGAAGIMSKNRYIRAEVVVARLRPRVQRWLELIGWVLSLPAICILLWQSAIFVMNSYERHYTANSILLTPMWIPQLVLPVGLALLVPQCALQVYKAIKVLQSGKTEEGLPGGGQ